MKKRKINIIITKDKHIVGLKVGNILYPYCYVRSWEKDQYPLGCEYCDFFKENKCGKKKSNIFKRKCNKIAKLMKFGDGDTYCFHLPHKFTKRDRFTNRQWIKYLWKQTEDMANILGI